MRDVALHCACGGQLVITAAPDRMQYEVKILVRWFEQEHRNHGSAGVREPRRPLPDSGSDSCIPCVRGVEHVWHDNGVLVEP